MIIVLIHWRIRPERDQAFHEYWAKTLTIPNREGFLGEFLSKVEKPTAALPLPWVTWHIDPDSFGDANHYINVGLWANETRFLQEIAPAFRDDREMAEFEKYRRRRLLLRPELHRIGDHGLLPGADSPGVA